MSRRSAVRYFFYGTLLDDVVRRTVLGRRVPEGCVRRAVLAGFRRVYRQGASYPVLVTDPAGRVEGVVVSGLGAGDAARLAAYEGPEYVLRRCRATTEDGVEIDARVFLPRCDGLGTTDPWCLEDWQRRFGERFRARIGRGRRAPRSETRHPGADGTLS